MSFLAAKSPQPWTRGDTPLRRMCDELLPLGVGTAFYELDGNIVTRQVEQFGDRWFSSRRDYHPEIGIGLTDIPYESSASWPETIISKEVFESVWEKAGRRSG